MHKQLRLHFQRYPSYTYLQFRRCSDRIIFVLFYRFLAVFWPFQISKTEHIKNAVTRDEGLGGGGGGRFLKITPVRYVNPSTKAAE